MFAHVGKTVEQVITAVQSVANPPVRLVRAVCDMLASFTAGPTTLAKDQDWQAVLMAAGGLLGGISAHLHNDAGVRKVCKP